MAQSEMGTYFPSLTTVKPKGFTGGLRILYIDESLETANLFVQRIAESRDWDVAHAMTAPTALEISANQKIDALVVSATLPETNVVELADAIVKRHPKAVTFILTHDVEVGGQSGSGRYQWAPKAIELPALVTAIERMATLVSWLTNHTTIELVSGIQSLPTIPSNYHGVIRLIHSPHSSTQEIGDAIEKDMGMTTRVLQVANSAYYGYSQKITHPTEAAQLLGIETLKSLVRYTHVMNNFPQAAASNAMFEKVWRHSLGVAAIAKRITMLETDNEALAEEAFTAGLLHDIGKLILMSLKPIEYKDVVRQSADAKAPIHLLERVKLGTTHAETGGYLLSLWGIPFPILEAVAWHHFPSECKEKKFSPLTAVHIANVADHMRTNRDNIKAVPPLDEKYLEEVGVLPKVKDWLEITPEKARRNEPVGPAYVVRPAAPVAVVKQETPAYVWVLLSIAAAATLTAIASLFVR